MAITNPRSSHSAWAKNWKGGTSIANIHLIQSTSDIYETASKIESSPATWSPDRGHSRRRARLDRAPSAPMFWKHHQGCGFPAWDRTRQRSPYPFTVNHPHPNGRLPSGVIVHQIGVKYPTVLPRNEDTRHHLSRYFQPCGKRTWAPSGGALEGSISGTRR